MKINGNMQPLSNHVTSLSGGKAEQIERQMQSLQCSTLKRRLPFKICEFMTCSSRI